MAPKATPNEDEFAEEEVVFMKDGRVWFVIDGKRYLLRRPKFKELRTFRESLNALAAEERAEGEPLDEEVAAARAAYVAEHAEQVSAQREVFRSLRPDVAAMADDEIDELLDLPLPDDLTDRVRERSFANTLTLLTWFRDECLNQFSTTGTFDSDAEDLPAWCASAGLFREISQHWSTVPRRPGVL